MARYSWLRIALVGVVLGSLVLGSAHSLWATATPQSYTTSNGILLQAGAALPIYQFSRAAITRAATSDVADRFGTFEPVGNSVPVFEDSYRGLPRFTTANTATNSLLSQFTATGGYFAYNVRDLEDDLDDNTVRDPNLNLLNARQLACDFLIFNNFTSSTNDVYLSNGDSLQGVRTPDTGACQDPSPYVATLIKGTGLDAAPGSQRDAINDLGVVVQVPLLMNQFGNTLPIPLGGPGGHISMLFRSTNSDDLGPTLDPGTPGLAAVSMPFFDRRFNFLRTAPAVDIAKLRSEVEQRVRAIYPTASVVNVPLPALIYMVGEPGVPQRAFEPMLEFQGASAIVNGETVILKSFVLPAVEGGADGFGPSVQITGPANASKFTPGTLTTLSGSIGAGTAPYTYTWQLDDGTPLGNPTALPAAGNVSAQVRLPVIAKDAGPGSVTVILHVEDADGAQREALVSLSPTVVPQIYTPLLRSAGSSTANSNAAPAASAAPGVPLAAVNYRFGSEMASDYAPFGVSNPGDLPGVVPDVNGLRNGLRNYGWGERFFWSNSGVWERDWRDCSLGGSDCTYGVDRADLAYYAGHGSAGGLNPSNTNFDSGFFNGTNARFQSVRWAMFSSCQTLRVSFTTAPNEPIRRWLNAFQGAHMLLGFNSNMADVAFGGPLVDNMRIPSFLGLVEFPWAQLSIRAAWVKTAFDMNAGKPAYIYATSTTVNPVNNKLPKGGDPLLPRPFPVNHYYWVWWECADTNPDGGLCQF